MTSIDPTKVFLTELHEIIRKSSEIRNALTDPSTDSVVWEEFKLSQDEVDELKQCQFNDTSLNAIEKIVRDSILGAFHEAFALMDAVGDPEVVKVDGVWLGLRLKPTNEHDGYEDFLHDELYSAYWDWLEAKKGDG